MRHPEYRSTAVPASTSPGNRAPGLQRRLVVGAGNTLSEREAERAAGRALDGPSLSAAALPHAPTPHAADERPAPASVHRALASPGSPMQPALRHDMEQRFGLDFSRVRIHTSEAAQRSARQIDALAYTHGRDIVFGRGWFAPQTRDGQRLLAHELAHVAQQQSASPADGAAGAPVVARAPGDGAGKPPFRITGADMEHLQQTTRSLMNLVDDATRARILDNDTVAVGLAVDADGDATLVYTVAQNRTYPSLRQAADRLGITRWVATPRAEGRGAVGAPGDAEQLMTEAAEANDFEVAGMAVTRKICPDCKAATVTGEKGGLPTVEVQIPRAGARPPGGLPANDNAIPRAPGAANDNAVPEGLGAANDNAIPRPSGTEARPAMPRGTAPEVAAPGAAGKASVGGVLLGVAAELAITTAIALLIDWLLGKLQDYLIERDMQALEPGIVAEFEKHAAEIEQLQRNGRVYGRITVEVAISYGQSTEGSGYGVPIVGTQRYKGTSLIGVGLGNGSAPAERSQRSERHGDGSETEFYRQSYSILIDDPQKRARDKEQAQLRDRLNRQAAKQPKPATPQADDAPQQPTPPLLAPPGSTAAAPPPEFLPGAPGEGPLEKAARWQRGAEAVGWALVSRGSALEQRLGSANPPTPQERQSFLSDESQWRTAVRYQLNWSIDNAPDKAVQDLRQLLQDPSRPGPKLEQIRIHLGG